MARHRNAFRQGKSAKLNMSKPDQMSVQPGLTLSEGALGPQVFKHLRDRIISGQIPPGRRISETEIARQYDVSRQPVREAFFRLADAGLVQVLPQRGTMVRRISIRGVTDARFVREAIEADIARLVAEEPGAGTVERLGDLIEQQSAVDGDAAAFIRLDEAFHHCLAQAADKTFAWRIVEEVKGQMDRVRFLSTRYLPTERLVDQHRAVLSAIEARDPDAASSAMRQHLRGVLSDLPEIARQVPEFFEPEG